MRFPRVGAATEQHGPDALDPAVAVKGVGHTAQRRGIAGNDPGEMATDRALIIHLGDERVAGQLVLLPALKDGLHARVLIACLVGGAQLLGRAVHHDVRRRQQVVEGARHRDPGGFHLRPLLPRRAVDGVAALNGKADTIIGDHIRYSDHFHIRLQPDSIGHALADDTITVYRDSYVL